MVVLSLPFPLAQRFFNTLDCARGRRRLSTVFMDNKFLPKKYYCSHGLTSHPSCYATSYFFLDDPRPATARKGECMMKKGRFQERQVENTRHLLPPEKLEIFQSLEGWAEDNMLPFLKPVEKSWQPQDFLPDTSSVDFLEKVKELQERAAGLPDEYYVCIVGNMITEEALPTYQTVFNTFDGVRDESGASLTSWARWTRSWTAEENRHGDLLNKYLYLSGRLDMRKVEKTIQYLIGSGMDIGTKNSPFHGFIYTSFQERATFVSHGNTARHAKEHGDITLAHICGTIASDERRHEMAYAKVVERLFEIDPETTMLSLAEMMQRRITMPAHFMYDGHDRQLFRHYSAVAQNVGIYTTTDYANNVEFFVKRWKVNEIIGLSGEGRRAQEYVCGLADRIRKTGERLIQRSASKSQLHMVPFTWIFNKEVMV